jgi:uncharacterized repeat protein (TIGR01451 family)
MRTGKLLCAPLVLAVTCASLALSAAPAAAVEPAPGWELTTERYPTNLPPGGTGKIVVEVFNVGEAESTGTVTVTDTLPEGLIATAAGEQAGLLKFHPGSSYWDCSGIGTSVVTCVNDPTNMPHLAGGAGGANPVGEGPNIDPPIGIEVAVNASPGTEVNRATIAGGGAPAGASTEGPVTISSTAAEGGITSWDVWFSNADGTLDTQAGSHPYEASFSVNFASEITKLALLGPYAPTGGEVRNIETRLPAGFIGNPTVVPQCTNPQLLREQCPGASQIGLLQVSVDGGAPFRSRVFNMVPPAGVAAEFGAYIEGTVTLFDASVRSGSDYGITERIENIARKNIIGTVLTLWGVPADPSHDKFRTVAGGGCTEVEGRIVARGTECVPSSSPRRPFLTLPTACGGPLSFMIRANTWQNPETFFEASTVSHDANGVGAGFTGCGSLGFAPVITTEPDTGNADTPTGLTVEVRPPVGDLEDPEGLGTSDIQNTRVVLPEGVVINPGQAAGLQACQPSEDGLTTESERANGEEDSGPAACPGASKVGTVKIKSPLIEGASEKEFEGNVYVLQSNPPDLKLLVAASADGVNLKLVGDVHLNEQNGQLEATFEGTPELPFTVFRLSFSGGAQAALDTPTHCGTYEAAADFTPWGSPFLGDFATNAGFGISQGPGSGACPSSPLPFSPVLTAGSTTDHAGGFTDFSMLLERGDGQQRIDKLQFKAPQGLAGMISAVPLCGEPQAAAGACPASSQVGHSTVSSGPGPYPLVVPQPGEPESPIYLTGPYDGAPFGLSIVTHVIAGPFNLGTIVTRAKIEINPQTAQITVTTDPLPQVVDGVPTDLRLVDAVIDRPGFMFNPTNCEPSAFSGTAWGAPPAGANEPSDTAAIGSHFGVGSCKELTFKPTFTTSTKAKASKANGAALSFKVSYPKGAQGSESWFNEAQFDIPKQLPARLSTLQQSCLAKTYETNRAACPKASIIGHAIVHTPVLPDPLEGPVYFVSYGATKFPDAVLDLTGDNVHIELHGETFISKTSVTSATFRNTPDVPFESIEVTVPTGPYSEFGANLPPKDNYNFCGQKLKMPTYFKAQNGLEIHQQTPVTITGCHKTKPKKHHKKTKHTTKHK